MDKIKTSKSKIKDLSLQKKLNMFYVEELEERLEMSTIIDTPEPNDVCWGQGDIDGSETGANTRC